MRAGALATMFSAASALLCDLCVKPSLCFTQRSQSGRRRRHVLATLALLLVTLLAAGVATAQAPPAGDDDVADEPRQMSRAQIEAEVGGLFEQKDYAAAETLLRQALEKDGANFVNWYNLACALAMQGKVDEAVEALTESLAYGFADLRQLRSDPHLASIRGSETYRAILSGWDEILEARLDAILEQARKTFGPRYTIEKDDTLRLAYVMAFEGPSFDRAKQELVQLAQWWEQEVVSTAGGAAAITAALARPTESGRPDPWVTVILPTPQDYAKWASRRFGQNWRNVGGSYSDDEKRLVAADLGGTLRHEFWHVLHWRDMRRRGQMHPIWIMEGLCSLVEDVQPLPDGRMRALPSWRTNMAKRRERSGALAPWSVLFDREHRRFITSSVLGNYADARAIFLFLAEQGKLAEWYATYVNGYQEDPTGAAAMAAVFGRPLEDVERQYRAWLRALPEAREEIPRGGATLPFEVTPAAGSGGAAAGGDGLTITTFPPIPRRVRGQPEPARLRMRDVVTAINDEPVRDMYELVRVMEKYQPGQEVDVSYRRGRVAGTAKVTLVAAP